MILDGRLSLLEQNPLELSWFSTTRQTSRQKCRQTLSQESRIVCNYISIEKSSVCAQVTSPTGADIQNLSRWARFVNEMENQLYIDGIPNKLAKNALYFPDPTYFEP